MTRHPAMFFLAFVLIAGAFSATFGGSSGQAPDSILEAALSVGDLRSEYLRNPVGIDVHRPRLSWKLYSADRGVMQTAYRLQAGTDLDGLEAAEGLVWDTGIVETDQSLHLEYSGLPVGSRQRYYWRVKVWAGDRVSEWSEPAFWEMGLLEKPDWVAEWITTAGSDETSVSGPSPYFRRSFPLGTGIRSARIYATSHGVYELYLNGSRVGDRVLAPGFASYNRRLPYQTYDVTDLVSAGDNSIGAILGDGWYRGFLGFPGDRNVFGTRLGLLVQLEVVYTDSTRALVSSDDLWRVTTGPILASDIYNGETYDARAEMDGWSRSGYDDSSWLPVETYPDNRGTLVADLSPPVRRIREIAPVGLLAGPSGETIVDMGQNLVGWVRLRAMGERGTTIRLTHAETLDADGGTYTDNLRTAAQTDTYILKGSVEEWFEPHFTFHGFRYVRVDGYPGELGLDAITGVVVHSDLEQTGSFETSDPDINQLQHNILWSQKGNFLAIPADCPQRDERLGWTGDAQVFARTASFNMDVAGFFTAWLRDLAADQYDDGSVPWVIPDVLTSRGPATTSAVPTAGVAGWSDAAIIVPWELYLRYGDVRILEEQYPSMKAWLSYAVNQAGDDLVWRPGFHFGDWSAETETPPDLIASAYLAHSAHLMSRVASVLGLEADASEYASLFERVRTGFQEEFVDLFGSLRYESQAGYALALRFDLLPDEDRGRALESLVRDIRRRNTHLSTGFVGTPHLCPVLTAGGRADVAYDLLFQTTAPSWLFPVRSGATTMWEQWRGIEQGVFADADMNSLNHYAAGAVGEWMYSTIAGINADAGEPGFKHVVVSPVPDPRLTYARASLETGYGTVRTGWRMEGGGTFQLDVDIPANSWATIRLPHAVPDSVRESGSGLEEVAGVDAVYEAERATFIEVGSGAYRFSYNMLPGVSTDQAQSVDPSRSVLLFLAVALIVMMAYRWRN